MNRHLVQLNIATLQHPLDDPRIADFVDALPIVNEAGERSPGYVWRLQSDDGNATDIKVFEDPLIIVNLTVWESQESLKAFAYRGIHRDFFRRRAEWFVAGSTRTALWWTPAGSLPTTDDAKRRLEFIDVVGTSPYAFAMGQNQPALVIERVRPGDAGTAETIRELLKDSDVPSADEGRSVVVELDDEAVGFGAYRLLDDTTAEVVRIHVAQSARGMRVGAAIVAELESLARADGLSRLLLETSPQMVSLYENFGFRVLNGSDPGGPSASVRVEKMLTA
jgi:ribosomal protein S18 acetylase RimI-like enzyme